MSDKELKFKFVLDEESFRKVKKALSDLTTEAKNFANEMSRAGGGLAGGTAQAGGGPGVQTNVPGNGKSATSNVNISSNAGQISEAFKKMKNEVSVSITQMSRAIQAQTTTQVASLNKIEAAVHSLNAAYGQLKNSGSAGQAMLNSIAQGGGAAGQAAANVAGAVTNAAPGTNPVAPPTQTPTTPGAVNPGGTTPTGRTSGIGVGAALTPTSLMQWALGNSTGAAVMRGAGMLASGGKAIVDSAMGFNNENLNVRANRGRAVNAAWNRTRNADVTDAQSDRLIAGLNYKDQVDILRMSGAPEVTLQNAVGGAKDFITSWGAKPEGMDPREWETKRYQIMERARGLVQDTQPGANMLRGLNYLENTRDERKTASRIFGMGAYFKPSGELAPLKDEIDQDRFKKYNDFKTNLHQRGFSIGELAGATVGARGAGGVAFGNMYGDTVMGAQAAGYDVTGALSAAARSGGNRNAREMVRGALGGGIDTVAGLQLAQSVYGYDTRGTVSGTSMMEAIQGGFRFNGGAGDMNMAARAQAGMQEGDRYLAGFDGYSQGMNLLTAINTKPGASTYAQDTLATGMTLKQMADLYSGKGNGGLLAEGYGFTASDAKEQLTGTAHGIFSRYHRTAGDDSPIAKAMAGMLDSGKDEFTYMRELSGKARGSGPGAAAAQKQLEYIAAAAVPLTGGPVEGTVGAIQAIAGFDNIGNGLLKKNLPYGGTDDAEKRKLQTEVKEIVKDFEEAKKIIDSYIVDLGRNAERGNSIDNFGKLLSKAEELSDEFARLAGISKILREKGESSAVAAQLRQGQSTATIKAGAPTPSRTPEAPMLAPPPAAAPRGGGYGKWNE